MCRKFKKKLRNTGFWLFPRSFGIEQLKEWYEMLEKISLQNGLNIELISISDDENKSKYKKLSFKEFLNYYSKRLESTLKTLEKQEITLVKQEKPKRNFSSPFTFLDELSEPIDCDVCGSKNQGIYRMLDSNGQIVIVCAECRNKHENKHDREARKQIFAYATIQNLLKSVRKIER